MDNCEPSGILNQYNLVLCTAMIHVKSQDTPQIEVIIGLVKPDSVDVTSVGVLVCTNLVKTIVMGKFKQLQKKTKKKKPEIFYFYIFQKY